MKKRIWELDALRGLCILGVIVIHGVYDIVELFGFIRWDYPPLFSFVQQWGGVLFLLISGISATLGSRSVRRGIMVFLFGMVISVVTFGMYRFGMAGKGIIIYFGVLHCLGICMILWPVFKKLPWWWLGILGLVLAAAGLYIRTLPAVDTNLLVPLGLVGRGFSSSDYFPLLPNLGFFLIGSALGKSLYRSKQSLLPESTGKSILARFLMFCGRNSLWIYLIHQPVISGICYLVLLLK